MYIYMYAYVCICDTHTVSIFSRCEICPGGWVYRTYVHENNICVTFLHHRVYVSGGGVWVQAESVGTVTYLFIVGTVGVD